MELWIWILLFTTVLIAFVIGTGGYIYYMSKAKKIVNEARVDKKDGK